MSITPAINQHWPEQGGIYIGSRLIDGQVHHIVIPGGTEFDHINIPFSRVEQVVAEGDELNGFSHEDGFAGVVNAAIEAASAAAKGQG